jgi:hypothetical protein
MEQRIRVFSFGGGVQSHAVLAMQAMNLLKKPYDVFVFSNVGADSEKPQTIDYLNRYTFEFAEEFNIPFVEVAKTTHGKPESLYHYIYRTQKSVPIPARMSNGSPGNRSCTQDFKITVVDRWIKHEGYTHAVVGLGLSVDEVRRRKHERWHNRRSDKKDSKPLGFWKRREHQLIDMGINRNQCHEIITRAGLPAPPKSACWFCPFTSRSEWIEMKRDHPELFAKAVALENHINDKRESLEKDRVYLHPMRKGQMWPLSQAVGDQLSLFEEVCTDECDSGYCFT